MGGKPKRRGTTGRKKTHLTFTISTFVSDGKSTGGGGRSDEIDRTKLGGKPIKKTKLLERVPKQYYNAHERSAWGTGTKKKTELLAEKRTEILGTAVAGQEREKKKTRKHTLSELGHEGRGSCFWGGN